MRSLGVGLLIVGTFVGVSWLIFRFWMQPTIETALELVGKSPEKLAFSSNAEKAGFAAAVGQLPGARSTEITADDRRALLGVLFRMKLCDGSGTDLVVQEADLPPDVNGHFVRYCAAVDKFPWTDFLGMSSKHAELELAVRTQVAPSPRRLIRSWADGFRSRVVGAIALIASLLGLFLTFLSIRERLDSRRKP